MLERYRLRYAAGQYWLLDMEQTGVPYKRPMAMNAIGAEIWEMLNKNWSMEQMVEAFTKEYQVDEEEIRMDIIQFQKQLTAYGVVLGE